MGAASSSSTAGTSWAAPGGSSAGWPRSAPGSAAPNRAGAWRRGRCPHHDRLGARQRCAGVWDVTVAADMCRRSDYDTKDERWEVTGTRGFARVNRCTAGGSSSRASRSSPTASCSPTTPSTTTGRAASRRRGGTGCVGCAPARACRGGGPRGGRRAAFRACRLRQRPRRRCRGRPYVHRRLMWHATTGRTGRYPHEVTPRRRHWRLRVGPWAMIEGAPDTARQSPESVLHYSSTTRRRTRSSWQACFRSRCSMRTRPRRRRGRDPTGAASRVRRLRGPAAICRSRCGP